jgi:hypothetical protein
LIRQKRSFKTNFVSNTYLPWLPWLPWLMSHKYDWILCPITQGGQGK